MPTIGSAPPPRIATTQSTSSVAQPAPATASNSSAANGAPVASSFQPATATPSPGLQTVLNDAKGVLDKVSGSDKDALLKMLNTGFPNKETMDAGMKALNKIAESGDIDQAGFDKLKKAVGWRLAGRQVVSQMLADMEKVIGEVTKKRGE